MTVNILIRTDVSKLTEVQMNAKDVILLRLWLKEELLLSVSSSLLIFITSISLSGQNADLELVCKR